MGKFVAGDVVVTTFPFSNLSTAKQRPALVLAEVEFGDLILCQITSKKYSSRTAIKIMNDNFQSGHLPLESYVRPDKLFTSEPTLIERTVGHLTENTIEQILTNVQQLFKKTV